MELDSLTKRERRLRTLALVDNLAGFLSVRQEFLNSIRGGGSYSGFMKSHGLDSETWETIVKTLVAAGVLSANNNRKVAIL